MRAHPIHVDGFLHAMEATYEFHLAPLEMVWLPPAGAVKLLQVIACGEYLHPGNWDDAFHGDRVPPSLIPTCLRQARLGWSEHEVYSRGVIYLVRNAIDASQAINPNDLVGIVNLFEGDLDKPLSQFMKSFLLQKGVG